MNKIIRFLILIWVFSWVLAYANVYALDQTDSSRWEKLNKGNLFLESGQLDEAQDVFNSLIEPVSDTMDWNLFAEVKINLAIIAEKRGDINNILLNYLELIRELDKAGEIEKLADTYFSLGDKYAEYGLNRKAAEYYILADEYFRQSNKTYKQLNCLVKLGEKYDQLEEYVLAEQYYNEAIELAESRNPNYDLRPIIEMLNMVYLHTSNYIGMLNGNLKILEICNAKSELSNVARKLNDIGYNYTILEDYNNAFKYFSESYLTKSLLNQPDTGVAVTLTNMAVSLHRLGNNQAALDTLENVLRIWKEHDVSYRLAENENLLSNIYLDMQNVTKASNYSERAISNALESENYYLIRDSYFLSSAIFQEMNDFVNAVERYNKYLSYNDSIQIKKKSIAEDRNLRERRAERVEKDIAFAIADKEIKDMALRQLQLEAEKTEKELELAKTGEELQKIETEHAMQSLIITQQALEAEKNRGDIEKLKFEQEIQNLTINQQAIKDREQKSTIKLLEQESLINQKEIERIKTTKRLYTFIIILFSVLIILTVVGYFQKQKDNRKLALQKRRIEETLKKLSATQDQLIESKKMASLGQLTAGIAHEINNPINYINSSIVPLQRDMDDIEKQFNYYKDRLKAMEGIKSEGTGNHTHIDIEYTLDEANKLIRSISEGATRTKEIVQGLKNFARMDKHQIMKTDLSKTIDDALMILRNKMGANIKIVKEYDDGIGMIECYPGQLSQVFLNLINNSMQALKNEGVIQIKSYQENKNVCIEISDNGPGIPGDIIDKIFDPFFTTKEVGEGTGLGLSISYGIIKQHSGEIEVLRNDPGNTIFKITIPVSQKSIHKL